MIGACLVVGLNVNRAPARPYRVVALVGASASFLGFGDVAAADGAALEKLREQAAIAGADAVIEIQRELYLGGVLITSTSLGQKPIGTIETFGPAATSPGVNYRGKAIRFD